MKGWYAKGCVSLTSCLTVMCVHDESLNSHESDVDTAILNLNANVKARFDQLCRDGLGLWNRGHFELRLLSEKAAHSAEQHYAQNPAHDHPNYITKGPAQAGSG